MYVRKYVCMHVRVRVVRLCAFLGKPLVFLRFLVSTSENAILVSFILVPEKTRIRLTFPFSPLRNHGVREKKEERKQGRMEGRKKGERNGRKASRQEQRKE